LPPAAPCWTAAVHPGSSQLTPRHRTPRAGSGGAAGARLTRRAGSAARSPAASLRRTPRAPFRHHRRPRAAQPPGTSTTASGRGSTSRTTT
jgi:hypothetical protein